MGRDMRGRGCKFDSKLDQSLEGDPHRVHETSLLGHTGATNVVIFETLPVLVER